jgi:hypothetical protein
MTSKDINYPLLNFLKDKKVGDLTKASPNFKYEGLKPPSSSNL